jgi:uncharacterized membrane protein YkvA (DUF1232 family)
MNVLRLVSIARSSLPRLLPLMRDGRVPVWLKGTTLVAGLLIISPFNIFGDIPILGLLDDITLLGLLATLFVSVASALLRKQETASAMRVVGPRPLPPSGSVP